ncbi:hypothetical protein [Absidia glauca]|uniref:Uncharacterized protein n=1 Tax=Absidia glauca TaxID=4829 RepID=A0A163JWQ7_ABSGL|nr:hypothetical protein [Absidia glauca]
MNDSLHEAVLNIGNANLSGLRLMATVHYTGTHELYTSTAPFSTLAGSTLIWCIWSVADRVDDSIGLERGLPV